MVEILKSFEQVASRFSPAVLMAPGLAMVVVGLVAWLAGTSLRRLVLGLVGVIAGGMAGLLLKGRNPTIIGLAAGGGAGVGVIAPRLSMATLLAGLGVAVAFAVLARTHLFQEQDALFGGRSLNGIERRLTVQESLDVVEAYVLDVRDHVGAVARRLAPMSLAILAAVGVGLLVMGLFFTRLAGALTCSMLGTGLIFTGLTLLLILKGSTPITRMERQGAFYGMVLLGMVAFGTLEQLLLCRPPERQDAPSRKSRSRREEPERGWRNR